MLEEMVASVMKKTLAQDFPHLKLPAAVFATIDSAAKSDAFDIEELIVHNEVTGEVFKAHITSYWYEYKLTVIDRFGNPDANYPALPGIKSSFGETSARCGPLLRPRTMLKAAAQSPCR